MDDPLGKHRKALDDLARASEHVRRILEPTNTMRDAIAGGPAIQFMKDIVAKDALYKALSPPNSALEVMRAIKLTDDTNHRRLRLHDLPLKSLLSQYGAGHSWLNDALAITKPSWMNAVESLKDIGRSQRMLEDMTKRASESARRFDQHTARVRAINDIIKPALTAQQPIIAVFDRLGVSSAAQLRDLFEPAWLRMARDAIARIQSEQAVFAAALPKLTSPFAGVDWDRMRRLVNHTVVYAEAAMASGDLPEAWGIDDIPVDEQTEFAKAMRPVVAAVEAAASSSEQRERKQAEAIAAIISYCESIIAKQAEIEQRLDGTDAKLAYEKRSRLTGWILALLWFLANTGWDLSKEWAASHTTPAINQILGLLDEPVSSASQPSAIRRDAAVAIAGTHVNTRDVRCLRVVTRKSLAAYASPASSEPCMYRLRSGQIVAVVECHKKWRFVEWFDRESGEFLSGWVRAKYITRVGP